jgi:hypothetical protein
VPFRPRLADKSGNVWKCSYGYRVGWADGEVESGPERHNVGTV